MRLDCTVVDSHVYRTHQNASAQVIADGRNHVGKRGENAQPARGPASEGRPASDGRVRVTLGWTRAGPE